MSNQKQHQPRGATPINRPLVRPELASLDTKTNRQRWIEYQNKLAAQEVAA